MSDPAIAHIGHNKPRIVAPSEADWLDDLQRRYPEIAKRLAEFKAAAGDYPDKISLDQPDVAEAMQDLLAQMSKEVGTWEAWEKTEKGPWNALVNVTKNFFTKPADEVGWKETAKKPGAGLIGKLGVVYKDYLDRKEAKARADAQAEVERQRAAAEAARLAQEKAEQEAREAQERAAAERRKEQEAREAAERATQERAAAEVRAAAAKEEERRLLAEKTARDRQEKENNLAALRAIKTHMKEAERLDILAEADEASPEELSQLDLLVRAGGMIGNLAGPVANSPLLDEEQKISVEATRARLHELRQSGNERLDKRARTKREKEAREAAEREAILTEQRAQARAAEDVRMAQAKANREREEAAAAAAKEEKRVAEQAARDARTGARTAESSAKASGKEASRQEEDADRAQNRADRQGQRLENAAPSDFNQTRGDLGSVGGTRRQWVPLIQDMDALRATMGPLGPHVNEEAVSAAVTKYMRVHQDGFKGDRVEGMLPGVVFTYERDYAIRH